MRGYYSDLAFKRGGESITTEELLKIANDCIGKTFTGYKGGDYTMEESTPLWMADYGCCGLGMVDIQRVGDEIIIKTKELD